MTPITVRTVYRGGTFEPPIQLDLPDNTPVQVQIIPLPVSNVAANSLFGAFPELAALAGDDFAWAKRLWEHGLEKQSRLLDELPQE